MSSYVGERVWAMWSLRDAHSRTYVQIYTTLVNVLLQFSTYTTYSRQKLIVKDLQRTQRAGDVMATWLLAGAYAADGRHNTRSPSRASRPFSS